MKRMRMSDLKFSRKKQDNDDNRDTDKMSITESLTGILKDENLEALKAERIKEKYETV